MMPEVSARMDKPPWRRGMQEGRAPLKSTLPRDEDR